MMIIDLQFLEDIDLQARQVWQTGTHRCSSEGHLRQVRKVLLWAVHSNQIAVVDTQPSWYRFVAGNITHQEAIDLCTRSTQHFATLGQPLIDLKPLEVFQLQANDTLYRQHIIEDNPDETNSGLLIYFQGFQTANPVD